MCGDVAEGEILMATMSDNAILREMIREVIEEDWKSTLAGAALAVCTAAGCAPVTGPGGQPASPADYGVDDDAYSPPGSTEMEWEEEGERPEGEAPPPTKLVHPGMRAGTMGRR
jgi:hypothetical protein